MAREITNPFAGAGRRPDRAEDLLRERAELFERKVDDARRRIGQIDLPGRIRRHPWPAIGIALALGALAGRGARRAVPATTKRSFSGAALGALGAVSLHVLRELALAQLGRTAKRWWVEHGGQPLDHADATYGADVDPYEP